jgi:predicted esterase
MRKRELIPERKNPRHRDAQNGGRIGFFVSACLSVLSLPSGCGRGGSPCLAAGYQVESFHSTTFPACACSIYRASSGCDETTVLYYFHGSGGDERSWPQANKELTRAWEASPGKAPVVVGLSFGKDWFIFPAAASTKAVPLESFAERLMPEIEGRLSAKVARRYAYGFSIGGLNAAELVFRRPELFEKAVLASPELYPFSIFASGEEVRTFAKGQSARVVGLAAWIKKNILGWNSVERGMRRELALLRSYIPDELSWAEADILTGLGAAGVGKKPRIYISCSRQDDYGFYAGSAELAEKARSLGYEVDFETLEGGHMSFDFPAIARFLSD